MPIAGADGKHRAESTSQKKIVVGFPVQSEVAYSTSRAYNRLSECCYKERTKTINLIQPFIFSRTCTRKKDEHLRRKQHKPAHNARYDIFRFVWCTVPEGPFELRRRQSKSRLRNIPNRQRRLPARHHAQVTRTAYLFFKRLQ
jgi:hypothetical protein